MPSSKPPQRLGRYPGPADPQSAHSTVAVHAVQLMNGLAPEDELAATDGMPKRGRSAGGVRLARNEIRLSHNGACLARERFVGFNAVKSCDAQEGAGQCRAHRRNGADSLVRRLHADVAVAHHSCHSLEPVYFFYRHPGTPAPRHPGTPAPRHPGAPAPRHPGTPAPPPPRRHRCVADFPRSPCQLAGKLSRATSQNRPW